MPFSSGTFSVVYNWATESGAPPMEIAKLDTQHADFATGLSNCILRDGSGLPTAATPWNGQNLTGVAQLEAARFVPTGSTVPSNGMYLPAANTVAFASNTTLRGSVNATGNWTIAAPGSGTAVTINSFAGGTALSLVTASNDTIAVLSSTGGSGRDYALRSNNSTGNFVLRDNTASTDRVTVAAAGNVTINAPSSGTALTVTGVSAGTAASFVDGTRNFNVAFAASRVDIGPTTSDILSLLTGGTRRVEVGNSGNVTINAPSSGTTLALTGVANNNQITCTDGTITSVWQTSAGTDLYLGPTSNHALSLLTNATQRLRITNAGNVTINAPSSGTALTIGGGGADITGTVTATAFSGPLTGAVTGNASTATTLQTARTINGVSFNGSANITVTAAAETLTGSALPALSGASLTALNASNLGSGTVPAARIGSSTDYAIGDGSTINSIQIGFRGIPQNSQSANYTLVLSDAGRQILHPSGAGAGDTFTIPANSSVAYAVGTVITFVNLDTNAVSIAITTDTLTIAGTSTTGTRTLAQNGYATAIKVTSTSWLISGVGLS